MTKPTSDRRHAANCALIDSSLTRVYNNVMRHSRTQYWHFLKCEVSKGLLYGACMVECLYCIGTHDTFRWKELPKTCSALRDTTSYWYQLTPRQKKQAKGNEYGLKDLRQTHLITAMQTHVINAIQQRMRSLYYV